CKNNGIDFRRLCRPLFSAAAAPAFVFSAVIAGIDHTRFGRRSRGVVIGNWAGSAWLVSRATAVLDASLAVAGVRWGVSSDALRRDFERSAHGHLANFGVDVFSPPDRLSVRSLPRARAEIGEPKPVVLLHVAEYLLSVISGR